MRKNGLILFILLINLMVFSLKALAEDSIMPGDIFYTQPVSSVRFSHVAHVQGASLGCDICHPGLFKTEALSVQKEGDFNMEALYKGKYCGACHNGEMAFSSDSQCARCHTGVKGLKRVKAYAKVGGEMEYFRPKKPLLLGDGDYRVRFSHQRHSGFQCRDCHTGLFGFSYSRGQISMESIQKGKYCGACHNGEMAFSSSNCVACHEGLAMR